MKIRDTITINIEDIDNIKNKEIGDFIQNDALLGISKLLEYDLKNDIKISDDFYDIRTHNSIYINGTRGAGKTELLIGIKNYLKKNPRKINKQLYFCKPIDPTLLHENEHFLTIIIARILNDISNKDSIQLNKEEYSSFYKSLNDIARAIDGVFKNSNSGNSSLEYISQDQSSLKLEEYMHSFFKNILAIVGKKRLVLLIDDVDMAFERGFDVLEVVRKYLSSPFIIPIITGDLELYKTIVDNNFISKVDKNLKNIYLNAHSNLPSDYLSKVIPLHRRVKIKTLYELSYDCSIEFIYGKEKTYRLKCPECTQSKDQDNVVYFRDIAKNIFDSVTLSNMFVENLFSSSLRVVIQFLHKEHKESKNGIEISNIKKIKDIEREYGLKLLTNIETEKIYVDTANDLYRYGEYEKAIKKAHQANDIKETAEANYIIAKSYFKLEDYISAKEYYFAVIELDEYHYKAYFKLGYMYRNGYIENEHSDESENSTAITYFKKSLEIEPNYDAYNGLGAAYLSDGSYYNAIEQFYNAIKLKPNINTSYLNIIESSFFDNMVDKKECTEEFKNDFLNRFKGDDKAMFIYGMTKILKEIQDGFDEEKIKESYNEWEKSYPNKIYLGRWGFELTQKYIDRKTCSIDMKAMLKKYLSLFLNKIK